jgi:hypothetical protein
MSEGIGWLPVEARDALEEEHDKASHAEAEALLALPPRDRVLALLERAACQVNDSAPGTQLRPADLLRVLASFDGQAMPEAAELSTRFPGLLRTTG